MPSVYDDISKFKAIFETRIPGADYKEKLKKKSEPELGIDSVTLTLTSTDSGIFTKLAYKYEKADRLQKKLQEIRNQASDKMKEEMGELFDAGDKVYKRVVETKSLIATLSRELTEQIPAQPAVPARQEEVKDYEKIAQELLQMMDGDLLKRAEDVVKKYTQTIEIPAIPAIPAQEPKKPSLTVKVKDDEKEDKIKKAEKKVKKVAESGNGNVSKIKTMCKYFDDLITSWAEHYDLKLDKVRKQLHASGELEESVTAIGDEDDFEVEPYTPKVIPQKTFGPGKPGKKVTDEMALEVKKLSTEYFGHGPYSSARISGKKVHRLSYHIDGFTGIHLRYQPIDDKAKAKLRNLRTNFLEFLKDNGIDTSKVDIKFHVGAGLYASIRTQIG